MDVSKYLAEYLLNKGQVRLPDFGSFVSTYQAARFREDNKTLIPPCRIYSFDPTRKEADTDLVLFIAGKENAPVSVAEKEVEEYVEGCHYVINKGKRLEITGIGVLFRNDSGDIEFEQEPNLLSEGAFYGLPELTVKPGGRVSPRSFRFSRVMMIILFAAVLVAGWFYAGFISHWVHNTFISTQTSTDSTLVKTDTQNITKTDTASVKPAQSSPDTIKPETQAGLQSVAGTEEPQPAGEQYYVVAGCFRSEEGAQKTVKELKEKGFNSRIFGKSKQGLNMVCYDSFSDKQQARKFLAKISAETDEKAWLLKY